MKQIIIALILLSTASAKASLIHHWAFDETNGVTATNSVSGGTNGTINLVGFVDEGKIGNAYEFDQLNNASNALVEMTDYKGILGTTSRTVNIWLKTDGATNGGELISWGYYGDGDDWELELQNDGEVRVFNGSGRRESSSTVTNDIWRMFTVAWTNDGSPTVQDAMLYIDGTNDPDGYVHNREIHTEAHGDVLVGKDYTGLLDDPAIWDEGLSPDEITCLYDAANLDPEYNAYHFDQLKQIHDAGTGSAAPLDEGWDYASGLTGSPGLNTNSVSKWFIFDGAAGTGVRLAGPGSVFRFE